MKDAIKIIFYFFAVLLTGCLLAPPLYWAGHASGLELFTQYGFQKYFNRAMMISAIVLLWPMIKWLRIKGWGNLGLKYDPYKWRNMIIGFLAAFGLLIVMGLIAYQLDVYRFQNKIEWKDFLKIPLSAIVVAFLEEGLFRAGLFGLVRRSMRPWSAAVFISAVYSIVHFLKPLNREIEAVTWWSGFQILPDSFHQFSEPLLLLGGFTTLFAIGMVLSYAVLRTGGLWLGIGLHAGWVAGNKAFNIVFKTEKHVFEGVIIRGNPELQSWFGERIEIGLAPLLTVLLTGFIVALLVHKRYGSSREST